MSGMVKAIGLMSGTSLDGIDAALVETDGEARFSAGPSLTLPYEEGFRTRLRGILGEQGGAAAIGAVEQELTQLHHQAVETLMQRHGIAGIDVVGFHGHTILHRPEAGRTRQIGDGALLARRLGTPVVSDFRSADVAAGGQGAPFAPAWHRALAGTLERPLAVLNLGGVANVTWIGPGETEILAFDTGPANALIDDFVARRLGLSPDAGGALAAAGRVDEALLTGLMQDPYFDLAPPKSLDRNHFHALAREVDRLGDEDGAATLAAFTIEATAAALRHVAVLPARWLVCGGGRHNLTLMQALATRLGVKVEAIEAIGYDGDVIEAQCFAYLALRSRRNLPLSLPTTTGAPRPMPGGVFWPAPKAAGGGAKKRPRRSGA
jgi:anhydro-N-acetylmuramic acid kinase